MSAIKLWHNPKCSKSRQAVAFLQEKGIDFEEIRYMDDLRSVQEIKEYLAVIGKAPVEVMRTKEQGFKDLNLAQADDETLIQSMAENPKLIERPVLFANNKAVIGRPTEALQSIL